MRKNRADNGYETGLLSAVYGEASLCDGEDAEHNVGECLSEKDRVVEIVDREGVLARLDLGAVCAGEDSICAKSVDFFLLRIVRSTPHYLDMEIRLTAMTAVKVSTTYDLSAPSSYPGTSFVTFARSSVKYATSKISFAAMSCRVCAPLSVKLVGSAPLGRVPPASL